jgi:predicted transcriptional regulator
MPKDSDDSKKTLKLSVAENEIMDIIWQEEQPVTASFILENMTNRTWGLSSVMTTLVRLCKKGFVSCDRSTRSNYYKAVISREDFRGRESREFLEKMHDSSITGMVASLSNYGSLSHEDVDELRRFLDSINRKVENRE